MADIRPLPALRYDPARAGDLARVIAPPYDVISPAERDVLYARSPHNVVRLILPREADRGVAAARTLREWTDAGVLVRDPVPAVYYYAQRFTLPDGSPREREGILCRLRLEDFSRGIVRPHERTLAGPKADRLAILRATGANLSPIFGLYARRGERVRNLAGDAIAGTPDVDLVDATGLGHRLWRVTAPAALARLTEALAGEPVIIADGHHRYETALAFRDEQPGNERARWILAYLANMEEPGVVILPTHRLVRPPLPVEPAALAARLADAFTTEPLPEGRPRAAGEIDCVLPGHRLRLRARAAARARLAALPPAVRALDVALLHEAILGPLLAIGPDRLDFTHDDAAALGAVTAGRAAAAFLLNPPSIAEVRAVCFAGELMPEKSTYFHPKLASGLVFDLVGAPWV